MWLRLALRPAASSRAGSQGPSTCCPHMGSCVCNSKRALGATGRPERTETASFRPCSADSDSGALGIGRYALCRTSGRLSPATRRKSGCFCRGGLTRGASGSDLDCTRASGGGNSTRDPHGGGGGGNETRARAKIATNLAPPAPIPNLCSAVATGAGDTEEWPRGNSRCNPSQPRAAPLTAARKSECCSQPPCSCCIPAASDVLYRWAPILSAIGRTVVLGILAPVELLLCRRHHCSPVVPICPLASLLPSIAALRIFASHRQPHPSEVGTCRVTCLKQCSTSPLPAIGVMSEVWGRFRPTRKGRPIRRCVCPRAKRSTK